MENIKNMDAHQIGWNWWVSTRVFGAVATLLTKGAALPAMIGFGSDSLTGDALERHALDYFQEGRRDMTSHVAVHQVYSGQVYRSN